jgi:hypothetical protein
MSLNQSGSTATVYTLPSALSTDVVVVASNYTAAGTLLYGTASSATGSASPATLAAGTAGQFLQSEGTTVAWASIGALSWTGISAAQTGVANNGYYVTTGNQALTLPTTAAAGTLLAIYAAKGSTGWSIVQNAGQSIEFGSVSTTVGAGGSLSFLPMR